MPSLIPEDAAQALTRLMQQTPAWQPWLNVLAAALHTAHEPAWEVVARQLDPQPSPAAVLLDGVTLTVEPRLARDWLRRLLDVAARTGYQEIRGLVGSRHANRLDALECLEAAVCQDEIRLATWASTLHIDSHALAAVVHLAALPLLQACGRALSSAIPLTWSHGYCPFCGAWPALAESRGLERARHLRCARCGGDWSFVWLRCPYCLTSDHTQLGSLVPEDCGESRKVDICTACKGYLKTVTTLRPWSPALVLLEDLDTAALDVAALAHGYVRPQHPAVRLRTRLLASSARRRGVFNWRPERT